MDPSRVPRRIASRGGLDQARSGLGGLAPGRTTSPTVAAGEHGVEEGQDHRGDADDHDEAEHGEEQQEQPVERAGGEDMGGGQGHGGHTMTRA